MSDTITAPNADAVAQPEVAHTPTAIADAGSALKEQGETWAVPAAPDAAAVESETPETPTETPAPDPLAGFQLDAEGRLHRADGTFADAGEIETWNSTAPAATPEPAAPEAQPIVVTLKGRDGKDVEIEVTDEAAAEVLRINANDGLRGAEYRKRLAAVQEKEVQFREFETMIETNPEAIILQHLPAEKQVSLAVALLAQHWDQLAPHLVKFDSEPSSRIAEAANARVRMTEQERTYEQRLSSSRYAVQVESAVRALLPETADEQTASAFMADAGADLGNAIKARNGAPVPIEDVKTVLARRLALYGFDRPATPEPSTPKRPLARPVVASQPAAPKVVDPGAAIRRTVTAQRIAAATPPQGAGAATVKAPLQPPTATIQETGSALKRARSWADV